MKKLFTIFSILFFALSFGQNQTFSGIKTFTSPPKFLNLSFSGTNTKYLTINAQGQLQFSNVSSPSSNTSSGLGYQVYAALINQNGTNAPSEIILEKTIPSVVWTRNAPGDYFATLPEGTPFNKIVAFVNNRQCNVVRCTGFSNVVRIQTALQCNQMSSDELLSNTFIEIRIYPYTPEFVSGGGVK